MDARQILQEVEEWIRAEQLADTHLTVEDGVDVLKLHLTGLGNEEGAEEPLNGEALMQVCLLPFSDDTPLVQFYTTVAVDLDEENLVPAAAAYNALSLTCPLGSFHVHEPRRQAYHKYCYMLLQDELEWVDAIELMLLHCWNVIDRFFLDALGIASDAAGWRG